MKATKPMWMVRAGQGGRHFDDFKERSFVAIGWSKIGSLQDLRGREGIAAAVGKQWPDWHPQKINMAAGQLYRFRDKLKIGDHVITYDQDRRIYLVGSLKSELRHEQGFAEDAPNIREVTWDGEVPRDVLSVSTKNSLGSISTLFRVSDDAAEEIELVLIGEAAPINEADDSTEDDLFTDTQERALEFVKDHVSRLDWEQMQKLVAGLLRAMGYKTRVSSSGPDRGKDIIASPDGFGFEQPRIVVEVKHRHQSMGSQEIRSFLGGRHQDDKGLYVSTGGFTRDAYYEAERAGIPIMLMNLDDLVEAVIEHYENLDQMTRQLVPLRRVYWPA